jgi:uncharacterized membrane protein
VTVLEVVFAVTGVGLVLLALLDALWTTLWVDGAAGPVTRRTTTWAWRAVLAAVGRRRHGVLTAFGPLVLVSTLAGWILLLAAGWVLLFASDADALISTQDYDVTWTGRLWFVAYTLFTVGNGDFAPTPGLWMALSSLVAASGMTLVTLAISYLLSVIGAVVAKRAFAGQVTGLGTKAAEFVLSGWNGSDLRSLDRTLADLSSQLARLTQQYESYPVLQYYHAAKRERSPVKAVAILDDALTLMRFGVPEHARPSVTELTSARSAVQSFLGTLESALITPAPDPPPSPGLRELREGGVPTVEDDEFAQAIDGLHERRQALLGLVRGDGWNWEE